MLPFWELIEKKQPDWPISGNPEKHRSSFFFNLSNTSTPLSFTFGELCIACLAP